MTSRPAPTKRSSAAASAQLAAKPPCQIHASAVVAEKASITGSHTVELGENTVVHPHATIKAENGKVIIGQNSIIYETAVVGGEGDIKIGDGVVIESGAIVEAKSIGDGTIIEVKVKIGRGATLGKVQCCMQCDALRLLMCWKQHCKVTPLNEIKPNENIPDYTVIYGDNQRRHNQTMASNPEVRDAKRKGQELHIQLLKKLIPDASAKYA